MTESMPASSCEDLHPGQTHHEWNVSWDRGQPDPWAAPPLRPDAGQLSRLLLHAADRRADDRRAELIEGACRKPVKPFAQYDGWPDFGEGDYVMMPDKNGDVVMSGDVLELRNGTPVRVQIEPGVTRAQAARLLRTIAGHVEADGAGDVYPRSRDFPGEPPF